MVETLLILLPPKGAAPMVRLASSRKLAVLVLSLVLLAPWSAQALPLGHQIEEPVTKVVSRLAELLTLLLGDVGCSMDPGGCHGTNGSPPAPPTENLDVGCSMDPSGTCGNRG
jgi:hypothetical protein